MVILAFVAIYLLLSLYNAPAHIKRKAQRYTLIAVLVFGGAALAYFCIPAAINSFQAMGTTGLLASILFVLIIKD